MQISDNKTAQICKETLVRVFIRRLYENKDINSDTYYNALAKLEEEKGYVNK